MAIYDASGTQLYSAYDASGTELLNAYDANGNVIFTSDPLSLKVMTYNVGGWYTGRGYSVPSEWDSEYYALQNGILDEYKPDILCIQEYRDAFTTGGRTALSVLNPYFDYIQTDRGTNDYMGHAVCSKYPIISVTDHRYTNENGRYYMDAVINVNGQQVHVICTHLSTDQAKRKVQAKELFDYVQTLDSFMACGDYNTTYADSTAGEEYTDVYLQYINAGYNLANCSEQHGFNYTFFSPTSLLWRCLDNIITSADIAINSITVDQTKVEHPISEDPNWLIDHLPLIAEVTI